jgi:transcriptional repressor NrdR
MQCPFCSGVDSKVSDSRSTAESTQIRRRRICNECGGRFTTYEVIERSPIVVIKKDGYRQEFDRQKVLAGLIKACEKRPVPLGKLENLVDEMEIEIRDHKTSEIEVEKIGEMVLSRLLEVDKIAYVRFVSVYRRFETGEDFLREVEHLFMDYSTSRKSVNVKVKQLRKGYPLPVYAHSYDAGVDLINAGESISIAPGKRAMIPTGIAVEIPGGFELQIRPRSGLAIKEGITVLNSPGTIDAGYRGEIGIILLNTDSNTEVHIKSGQRIAQAVLARCERLVWEEVDSLEESSRGEGGFGSSGLES